MMNRIDIDWVQGRASLGAAAGWTAEEIRLVADLGYALAEQGRNQEAITVFNGLAALAPATGYFQAALGALWLREGETLHAIRYLNSALTIDPQDIGALVNRGEAFLQAGEREAAARDLEAALRLEETGRAAVHMPNLTRARALLAQLKSQDR